MHAGSIRLPDGRRLGFSESGDRGGVPLFLFHGTPGCRFRTRSNDDPIAAALGVRVIMPERPGYGLSDVDPHSTLLSWADDVLALADHLQLGRFAVAGASGGGAFVAACASRIAARLTCAVIISSSSPIDDPAVRQSLSLANRFKLILPKHALWFLRFDADVLAWLIRRKPEAFIRLLTLQMSRSDKELVLRPGNERREGLVRFFRECFRQGSAGIVNDLRLLSRPWGFSLEQIRGVPVHVWHGEEDAIAPVEMGRHLAAQIPGATARFLPNEGHLLVANPEHWRELLETVRAAAGGESWRANPLPSPEE